METKRETIVIQSIETRRQKMITATITILSIEVPSIVSGIVIFVTPLMFF